MGTGRPRRLSRFTETHYGYSPNERLGDVVTKHLLAVHGCRKKNHSHPGKALAYFRNSISTAPGRKYESAENQPRPHGQRRRLRNRSRSRYRITVGGSEPVVREIACECKRYSGAREVEEIGSLRTTPTCDGNQEEDSSWPPVTLKMNSSGSSCVLKPKLDKLPVSSEGPPETQRIDGASDGKGAAEGVRRWVKRHFDIKQAAASQGIVAVQGLRIALRTQRS